MGTITTLGFTIVSIYNGAGMTAARRDLNNLNGDLDKSTTKLSEASKGFFSLSTAALGLGPALIPIGAATLGAAASFTTMAVAGGAAAGVIGLAFKAAMAGTGTATAKMKSDIDGVKSAFSSWGNQVAPILVKPFTTMTAAVSGSFSKLTPLVSHLTPLINQVADAFKHWTDNNLKGWVSWISATGGPILANFITVGKNLGRVFGDMLKAFGPMAVTMSKGLAEISAKLKGWADTGGFQRFIATIKQNGPAVSAFFKALGDAIRTVSSAMNGLGIPALTVATLLLKIVAAMPPAVIQAIVIGVLALRAAMLAWAIASAIAAAAQVALDIAASPFFLLMAGAALTIGLVVLAIAALAVGIYFLVTRWDTVKAALVVAWNATWTGMKIAAEAVWTALKIAWSATVSGLTTAWNAVSGALKVAWSATWNGLKLAAQVIWTALKVAWQAVAGALAAAWTAVSGALTAAWNATWNGMKLAASVIWTAMETAWRAVAGALATAWTAVSGALSAAWNATWSAMKVAGQAIWTAMTTAWRAVAGAMATAWSATAGAITAAWNAAWTGMKAVGQAVWSAMQSAWHTCVTAISNFMTESIGFLKSAWSAGWNAIKAAASAVWGFLKSTWHAVVTTLSNTMTASIGFLKNAWSTGWNAIKAAGKAVWDWLKSTWHAVVTTLSNTMTSSIGFLKNAWKAGWDWIKSTGKTIWDAIKGAFNTLVKGMQSILKTGVSTLKKIWNGLKAAFEEPVKFVVKTVINDGIIKAINWVIDKLGGGANTIKGVTLPFANGGYVSGPGSATSDSIPARLSDGEYVLKASAVRQIGVDKLNEMNGGGGLAAMADGAMDMSKSPQLAAAFAQAPAMASGGLTDSDFEKLFEDAIKAAGGAAADMLGNFIGGAVKTGGNVAGDIVGGIGGLFGHPHAGDSIKSGADDVAAGIQAAFGMLEESALPDLANDLVKLISGLMDGISGTGGPLGSIGLGGSKKIFEAMLNKAKDWVLTFLKDQHKKAAAVFASSVSGTQSVQAWAPLAAAVLAMEGLPASWLPELLVMMQQESGGNPNIVNNWDSNAAAGTPSMGLMQVIGPTFAAYHWPGTSNNILDPVANMAASFNYINQVYGYPPGSPYASGTNNASRGWHLVGEHGPEMRWFDGGEHVATSHATRRMMHGDDRDSRPVMITVENHWHGNPTRDAVAQAEGPMAEKLRQACHVGVGGRSH